MASKRASAPDATRLIERLLTKLRARDAVDQGEAAALAGAVSDIRRAPAGKQIIRAGALLDECLLLIDGFVCRYKDLSGGQRQVMEIHVPGDFLDLHSFMLRRLEHHVGTLSPVTMAVVPHAAIREITDHHPHLARLLWFSTLLDAAIHRERILTVGRRSAIARVAHLLCELYLRLDLVGLAADNRFALPLTQLDLADATGLTPVHVNRMLRRLRDSELLTFRGGEVTIHDWAELRKVAEFDPTYLYLGRRDG